jgi:hypothetical protein
MGGRNDGRGIKECSLGCIGVAWGGGCIEQIRRLVGDGRQLELDRWRQSYIEY